MRRIRAATALLAGLLLGCGGPPSTRLTTAPPHGGSLVDLPDGKGLAEIVTRAAKKGDATQSEFTVYFLASDRTTTLSPTPTTASLTISTPQGEKTVELKPWNEALISLPAASVLDGHDLDGTLNVEIGGQTVNVPIGGR